MIEVKKKYNVENIMDKKRERAYGRSLQITSGIIGKYKYCSITL